MNEMFLRYKFRCIYFQKPNYRRLHDVLLATHPAYLFHMLKYTQFRCIWGGAYEFLDYRITVGFFDDYRNTVIGCL